MPLSWQKLVLTMFIERGQTAKTIMTLQFKLSWNLHVDDKVHASIHVVRTHTSMALCKNDVALGISAIVLIVLRSKVGDHT